MPMPTSLGSRRESIGLVANNSYPDIPATGSVLSYPVVSHQEKLVQAGHSGSQHAFCGASMVLCKTSRLVPIQLYHFWVNAE
nr:hypothetical protein CFP56_44241 [Quercus suber]